MGSKIMSSLPSSGELEQLHGMLREQHGFTPGQMYSPFDPRQQYDYLGFLRGGQGLSVDPTDPVTPMHGDSSFKHPDHPNRYVRHQGQLIDTLTGRTSDQFDMEDWDRITRNAPQQFYNPFMGR